ncbi:hypothetical protein ACSLM9_25925, partial [Escherichia coli]|uniref:hypothetical protein n=1 Tax=Escherichia coli TaxID=562 RepID=UPI003EE10BE2
YTLWGNELEKYRTRIFESVDLMRDRSGYICDRSEIGQRPPLHRDLRQHHTLHTVTPYRSAH